METPFVIFAMIIFLLGWGIGLADLFTRNKKKAKGIWKLRELEEEISLRKEEKEKISDKESSFLNCDNRKTKKQ